MGILPAEQKEIEETIAKDLRDVSRPNPYRLKAALRILMTTNVQTFISVCSPSLQKELHDFISLIEQPEILAPESCKNETDRQQILQLIKQYTLNNFHLLDNRTAILPNTHMVQQSIMEGERLKSVVHASAMRNIVTHAHYFDGLEKKLKQAGNSPEKIEEQIKSAMLYTQELHKAVLEGNISHVLKCLSYHGVDVNYPNEQGMTPLHLAAREGLAETVKILLTVPNIRVDLVSNNGWTALHIASRMGYADVVDALLTVPTINANAVNSDGWSALHWAAWHGFAETVTVLITAPGIEINLADKNGTTPLHMAARNGHPDIIAILLSIAGIQVNAVDNEQKTPLQLAVIYDHEAAVKVLLFDSHIDLNGHDMDGLTALHWAARNGYMGILQDLLEHPDTRRDELDNSGLIPYDWALRHGHMEAAKALNLTSNASTSKKSFFSMLKNIFKKPKTDQYQ